MTSGKNTQDDVTKEDATIRSNQRFLRRLMMAGLVLATTAYTFQKIGDYTAIKADQISLIFFLLLFLGVPAYLIAKYMVPKDNKDYSQFDVVVAEVARSIQPIPIKNDHSPKTPLLLDGQQEHQQPPSHVVIQMESKQTGIASKKSGEPFRLGNTSTATLHLNFGPNAGGGLSISGTATTKATKFSIQEGVLCAVSGKAWWVEHTNDLGRVISGEFSNDFTSFSGEWYSSDGSRGSLQKSPSTGNDDVCIDYAVPL